MPIRPENVARYPADWDEITARIRRRAGNKCEQCGVANGSIGGRAPDGKFHASMPTGTDHPSGLRWPRQGDLAWCEGYELEQLRVIRIVLTVAHVNHVVEDCSDDNLKAWCQRCHNRHDAQARADGIRSRRRADCAMGDLF